MAKLHLCSFTFDFSDPASHVHEKEVKRATLLELVDHVNSGSGKFKDALAPDIVGMLAANLFRALPPAREHGPDAFDAEEEEPNLEPAWPHLQIVYEFLLRYVVSGDTDAKTAKRYIDQQFVVRLLDLFDSGARRGGAWREGGEGGVFAVFSGRMHGNRRSRCLCATPQHRDRRPRSGTWAYCEWASRCACHAAVCVASAAASSLHMVSGVSQSSPPPPHHTDAAPQRTHGNGTT